MRPIRQGDGTGLSVPGFSEVRTGDGTVLWSAGADIPDSAVAQFNAQNLSGFNDGDTVSTWPDEVAGNDASASGAPKYRASAINGYPAVQGDGRDDKFDAPTGSTSQPVTVFTVLALQTTSDNINVVTTDNNTAAADWSGSNWRMFAGKTINGSTDSTVQLIGTVFDGGSSEFYEDGSQTASGDAGTQSFGNIGLMYRRSQNDQYTDAYLGFVEVHDGLPSNGYASREQEIADMWGITI